MKYKYRWVRLPFEKYLKDKIIPLKTHKFLFAHLPTIDKGKYKAAVDLMNQAYTSLTGELEETLKGRSELLNIRDEMLGVVQQTRYLLTLG